MVKVTVVVSLLLLSFQINAQTVDMTFVRGGDLPVYGESGVRLNTIQISDFWAAKYEITNRQWMPFEEEFRDALPKRITLNSGDDVANVSSGPENPLVGETWYEAIVYCNWLSRRNGLKPVYIYQEENLRQNLKRQKSFRVSWDRNADGYRLATLAEWVYMATDQGTSTSEFAGSSNMSSVAVHGRGQYHTERVGTKRPNRLGIYDLSGNAAEWCWDFWQENYLSRATGRDPTGPSVGSFSEWMRGSPLELYYKEAHAIIGGNFYGNSKIAIMKSITAAPAVFRDVVGIRLVRSVIGQDGQRR